MGRIRTIKPEFPQSESMGRVSREARLCFILLWTVADDEGRTRGSSRMLASLLFPYDDDAKELMDGWLDELEAEGCVLRYQFDGAQYLQVCNWREHQKIDRPSRSKLPAFDEPSRGLAKPLDPSWMDQDQDQDQGSGTKDQESAEPDPPASAPPSPVLVEVPCKGTGAKSWALTQAKLDEWTAAFPGIDVRAELRKAVQWLRDNPTRGKTARGMPAFFGRWLSSAQDRGSRNGGTTHGTNRPNRFAARDAAFLDQLDERERRRGDSAPLPDVRGGDDAAGLPDW